MIKGTMNTTTNLFILLIVTLVIFPATAIRYAHGQPVPRENNNTGNSTSPGGLPPPPPPATTANSPTSPQTCDSPNNCPSPEEQDFQHRLQSGELQHRFDYGRNDRCDDRGDDRGDCDSSEKTR